MTLADYLRLLRAQWYVVAACAVLGVVVGLAVSAVVSPTYDARATLYFSTVVTGPASGTVSAYETNLLAEQQVKTTSLLVDTERVAQEVIDDLRLPMTPAELIPKLTAESDPDTVVLAVGATDPSPQRAADIANATGRALVRLTDTINKENAAANLPTVLPSVRAQIIQAAVVPATPSAGTRRANLTGGLLAGLLLGMALVLLRKLLDRRVRAGGELAALADAPTMGVTPRSTHVKLRPVAVVDDPGGELAGAYRQLRVNVGVAMAGSQVVAVVSPGSGDGRTLAVCNLAVAFAESGCRVAVVEADLRNPRMSHYLGFENEAGLSEVLAGTRTTREVVRRWNGGVDVVLAGRERSEPGHLIASHRLLTVLEELETDHDVVLVDTPAAAVASDVAVLGARTESVLLLARQGRTRKADVERLVEALRLASGTIIGSVLTMERGPRGRRGSAPVPPPRRPAVAAPAYAAAPSPSSSTPSVAAFDAPTLRNVAPVRTLTPPAQGSGSSTSGSSTSGSSTSGSSTASTPGSSTPRSPIAGSPVSGSSALHPAPPALPVRKRAVPQAATPSVVPPLPPLQPLPTFEDVRAPAAPAASTAPVATPPGGTPTSPAAAPLPPAESRTPAVPSATEAAEDSAATAKTAAVSAKAAAAAPGAPAAASAKPAATAPSAATSAKPAATAPSAPSPAQRSPDPAPPSAKPAAAKPAAAKPAATPPSAPKPAAAKPAAASAPSAPKPAAGKPAAPAPAPASPPDAPSPKPFPRPAAAATGDRGVVPS